MKNNYIKIIVLLFCFLPLLSLNAQERIITGTVIGQSDGLPLPGVSVSLKGTTLATQTGPNGRFSIRVTGENPVLVFSYIGYIGQQIPVRSNTTINVSLVGDATQLGEVVVTALGITRSKNELPYAAQQVGSEEIARSRSTNFINTLSGKVAGLDINQGNGLGGSSNVIIRGYKSLTANNQALYVIDGVPVGNSIATTASVNGGNSNSNDQSAGRGGYDYGNPISDINPDDIESVNVLKGAAATALYGSRAANGVIIVTTKKGRKNSTSVTINSGLAFGTIDRDTYPKYQKEYGGGYSFEAESPDGYFGYQDVDGDGVDDLIAQFSQDASFGKQFDPNLLVFQWDAFDPFSPNYLKATPWVAAQNGPETFFETSVSSTQSISVDGGGDRSTFKMGYLRSDDKGILPNSKLIKNQFNFSSSYDLAKNLTASGNINYSRTDGKGRYGTGYDGKNPNQQFRQWFQSNVDIKEQKTAYFRNRQNITWNWTGVDDLSPIYSDNLYWTRFENFQNDTRNHYFGYAALAWKPLEWFDVLGRVSLDNTDEMQEERIAVGSADVAEYRRLNRSYTESNYDLLLNFNKDITPDISFKGLLGTSVRRSKMNSVLAFTNGGLVIPRLYSLSNSVSGIEPPTENYTRVGVDGYFGSATFGYKELLFLDITGRNDISTTLPPGNNSFFYPSVAGSFVFSELMKEQSWLTYGKLRLNYAEVGNDAPALSIYDVYDKPTGFSDDPLFSVPNTKNNINLKPERTKSIEGGIETAFLNRRIGFDFTWYKTNTVDQIMPVSVSAATGYISRYVNAGEIENKGIESTLFFTPVTNSNFSWTVNVNFARNRNKVISLYEDVENLLLLPGGLTSLSGGVTINATKGQPYGIIKGTGYVFHENGQPIVNQNGYYMAGLSTNIIGDPNPEWTGGVNNTLRYKDFGLNFLVDVRKGGDIFSLDQWYGQGTGMYVESAGLNDLGFPKRNTIAEGGGVILPGVKEDGSVNDIRVENYDGYITPYGYPNNPPRQTAVYDGSFVKLRELALRYSLPQSLIEHIKPFKGIDVSLIGRNLWIIHKNLPYSDPEDALGSGNIRGYQSGAYPAVRTFGFNVKFTL